jgi:hypothetical protein
MGNSVWGESSSVDLALNVIFLLAGLSVTNQSRPTEAFGVAWVWTRSTVPTMPPKGLRVGTKGFLCLVSRYS